MPHQVRKQPELGRGQLDRYARAVDRPAILVELEVRDPDRAARTAWAVLAACPRGPPQDRTHPSYQSLDRERLGHVVVAADREASDSVGGGVAGGEEDDRYLVPRRPESPAHIEAVHIRHHDVQHDEVWPRGLGLPQRLVAARRSGDRAPVELECDLDKLTDVGFVVDDEHLGYAVVLCHDVLGLPSGSLKPPRPRPARRLSSVMRLPAIRALDAARTGAAVARRPRLV